MSKKFTAIITLVLSITIALMAPLQAFAASAATAYISDIKISYGKNAEEAKSWLEGQGYKVIDADLNEEADSALSSSRAVYLGYKTTRKVSEAITDLKVMNMKGNYSFDAYEMVLKDKAAELEIFVSQLTASLEEYRENYKNGLYKAIAAHDLLDKIYDDDTDNTMGELLLNKTVQELGSEAYEALPEEEKANHADMVKILMQGNSSATLAIEQYLCMASDTSGDSFISRLSDFGCYDDFETSYAKEKGISDGNALEKALEAEYDDTAIALASGVEAFRANLAVYTESEMFGEENEDTIIAYFNENGKDGDYILFCNARNLYYALTATEFEDGNLYEFFTTDDYDLVDEDRYMIYPLVASLSAGQRASAEYVSLVQLFDNGILDNDGWKNTYDNLKTQVIDSAKTVSAYAGINRALFGSGVALTNAAKQLNDESTRSYVDYFLTDSISDATYFFLTGFAVTAIATIGSKIAAPILQNQISKIYNQSLASFESMTEVVESAVENAADSFIDDASSIIDDASSIIDDFSDEASSIIDDVLEESFTEYEGFGPSFCRTHVMRETRYILNHIGNVCCIIMIIFAALTVASAWRDIYNFYHTDKTPIPAYMVDEATSENGTNSYTYYEAVTCNRLEKGFVDEKSKILEAFGDLNGDVGKEWVALYFTKDSSAGNPIKAEFLSVKGNASASGKIPLTMFGEKNAFNLVDERFAFNDEFGGIYLYYAVGSAALTSSAISSGTLAIITVAAIVIGFIPAFLISKKKKSAKEA